MISIQEKINTLHKYISGCSFYINSLNNGYDLLERGTKPVIIKEYLSNTYLADVIKDLNGTIDSSYYIGVEYRPVPYEDWDDEYHILYKDTPYTDEEYLDQLENILVVPWHIGMWVQYKNNHSLYGPNGSYWEDKYNV